MDERIFQLDVPGACARIDAECDPPRLEPDGPATMTGNHWYAFMVGIGETVGPIELALCWPPAAHQVGGEYAGNHPFAEVLDRIIFLDHGDGHWQRLEHVERHEDVAHILVPPGPAGRRLAVGMPVTGADLDDLLAIARGGAHVEHIGTAPEGSPIHAISLGDAATARGSLVISAYQHFSEWAGIRMVAAMLRYLLGEDQEAEALRRRWRWIFYPCINADALYLGWQADPQADKGINLNRDWGPFVQPQTRAVRDHMLSTLASGPPLRHLLDLHMGWHSRDTCGAGLTVFEPGAAEPHLIDTQAAFARHLYDRADYTDFIWHHGGVDRPNFAGWATGTFHVPGQTLEVSRHRWRRRADNAWLPPSPELERRLGRAVVECLDTFHQDRKD